MKGVTPYSGWAQFYFRRLLGRIVNVGRLGRPGLTILDFGCGKGELKRLLKNSTVLGYDIIPSLSDVEDWRKVDFDVLVANEVFYAFNEGDLENLLLELRKKNKNLELVVGISRQGLLNKIGKHLFGGSDAHSLTKMMPQTEVKTLERHCVILRRSNVLFLANVYSLKFRT